jgi:hypothetical protein
MARLIWCTNFKAASFTVRCSGDCLRRHGYVCPYGTRVLLPAFSSSTYHPAPETGLSFNLRSRKMICYRITLVSLVLLVMAFLPVTAFAQLQAGNLYGTVLLEEDPLPLPGVMITLQGQGAPQVQITNDQGHFRFLDLPAGVYSLVASLEGFSTIQYANIVINIGRNTHIEILMGQSR